MRRSFGMRTRLCENVSQKIRSGTFRSEDPWYCEYCIISLRTQTSRLRPQFLPTKADLALHIRRNKFTSTGRSLGKTRRTINSPSSNSPRSMGIIPPTPTLKRNLSHPPPYRAYMTNPLHLLSNFYPFSCDRCHSDLSQATAHLFSWSGITCPTSLLRWVKKFSFIIFSINARSNAVEWIDCAPVNINVRNCVFKNAVCVQFW